MFGTELSTKKHPLPHHIIPSAPTSRQEPMAFCNFPVVALWFANGCWKLTKGLSGWLNLG